MEASLSAPAGDPLVGDLVGAGGASGLPVPTETIGRRPVFGRLTAAGGRARLRSRAVVLEPDSGTVPGDRLEAELDVVLRAPAPHRPERLAAVLGALRPALVLLKYPLDDVGARLLTTCLAGDVEVLVLAQPAYGLLGSARIHRLGGLPWLRLRGGGVRPGAARVKRLIDLCLTLLIAPLVVPLVLLIAVAVGISGPPLYVQRRVGLDGRSFQMIKFRTMRVDAERETGATLACRDDERVTRVGRLLRPLRLDELPQLWNVLCGTMSLVGPRPERPEFVADHLRLSNYDLRSLVRPGLTGIAQLTGGYEATAEDKLRCDLLYLNCWSLRLDLKLLGLTAVEFLRGFPRG
ncbi:MAG TPA: sugar transferase [Rugosimonospora sp.]|nr:sugar transferase [Rugosimonospora sp.]